MERGEPESESESESRLRALGFGRLRAEDMVGWWSVRDWFGRSVVVGVPRPMPGTCRCTEFCRCGWFKFYVYLAEGIYKGVESMI